MRKLRGQIFECNGAIELAVERLVDDTHAALTELGNDLVVGYGLSDQRADFRPEPNGI